tara:strand:- start:100 stop:786 length:687 start_codon:yes stop_codon:yes gene_type:complete
MPIGENYTKILDLIEIKPSVLFEVGSRYGFDSITMSKKYKNSKIYSYECNPATVDECRDNLKKYNNVIFNGYGLGNKCEEKKFNIYAPNKTINKITVGASSFYKRSDSNNFKETLNKVKLSTLKKEIEKYNIETIDILCMDVQGYELNILKGAKEFINRIKYIIMEQPKPMHEKINNSKKHRLPINDYESAPIYEEIEKFMKENNFVEVYKKQENLYEDNVLYKNKLF